VIARTDPRSSAIGGLSVALNLGSLVLVLWGITTETHLGLSGRHLAAAILLGVAASAWVGWVVARFLCVPHVAAVCLPVMGVAGGAVAAFAPLGLVFVGVPALGATLTWPFRLAAWIAATGPASMLITAAAIGRRLDIVFAGLAASLTGALMGISRRDSVQRTEQAALVQVSEARAEAEQARAELLAGRNHLARELHDVLAHTLSALSLQLEALDALISAGTPITPEVREQLDRTKRLVRDGLDEARGAVQALREDAPPLEEQLARLTGTRPAGLHVSGTPRPLQPEVSLALYRVAQEALTNVVKHAPGAVANVELCFDDESVILRVSNPASGNGSELASSGGGYGLQGIRERVLLLGGAVDAGPEGGGWEVRAVVPA
jgi:signal transduction histidine kinase